jgi:hypothetical protein
MRRHFIMTSALAVVLAGSLLAHQSAPVPAQAATGAACSKVWVGHEAEFEEALRLGKVTKIENVPIGVTKPQRGMLEPPVPVARFMWKQLPPGYRSGFMESYKAEIAAYELDKLLELHMVPPTVQRSLSGLNGAAMYWIENTKGWDMKKPPQGPEPEWSKQITRMKMFDLLIGNIDRNQGNLIYDADWHLFLIDHSRAFIGKKDLKGIAPMARVDRALWTRMQALTEESLKQALGEWVGGGDLRAILTRRDVMAKEIQKLIAEKGAAAVWVD